MARLIYSIFKVDYEGRQISLQAGIYKTLFASWLPPVDASLAFALSYVLFWFGILYVLYRKNIFLKV
jgi:predicted acyltransferase